VRLLESIDRCEVDKDGSVAADYEFHARNLIRSILAYIEAVTFSVKVSSVEKCLNSGIEVSDHERYLSIEIDSELNDNGEIIERPAKLRLASNVRFAFRLFQKASSKPTKFDPKSEWWSCLKETIRVRDRLTHPRMPEDIDISGDEIIKALKAMEGFSNTLLHEDGTPSQSAQDNLNTAHSPEPRQVAQAGQGILTNMFGHVDA
jgi:hypothetical protein